MPELLLGVDVGTSAVKAGLFTPDGRLLGLGRAPYAVSNPRPGWAECDPELWWRGFVFAVAEACADAQCSAGDVAAVGTGVLFPCVVPLDEDGNAVHQALLYSDRRGLPQARRIEETVGRAEFEAKVGNRLVPGNCAVPGMAWLRDERPEAYERAGVLGFANTFVNARLTAEFAADPSHAALSGLMDIRDPWQWDEDLCEQIGIDAGRLPRIAGAAEVMGTVTAAASEVTGLRPGTPVVCGAGDVIVSAVGGGSASPTTMVYIAGSTDCVALPCPEPPPNAVWAVSAYVPRGLWLAIGATTSSGVAVEWFCREVLEAGGSGGVAEMTDLADAAPIGSNGVLFVPYLQGERTPVWDPEARGVFIGLTSRTTRSDLARAVLEGTAFALRQVLESAPAADGAGAPEVRAVGGGMRNPLWNRIKADCTGRAIDLLDFQEPGTLGAALLAGIGADIYPSFEEAVGIARSVTTVTTVEPDARRHAAYAEMFDLYSRVHADTVAITHGLARLG